MADDRTKKMRQFAAKAIERRETVELMKALNLTTGKIVEGMAAPHVFSRFPHLKDKLPGGLKAEPIAMMVDLSPFSSLAASLSAPQIAGFLDEYYSAVAEMVEAAGGVVEKYIGDAVLALFGDPFVDTTPELLFHVVQLGKRLVEKAGAWFGGEVSAKVALSHGDFFIGYVGPTEHQELTIIGNPLTVLFRLEAECSPNQIIMLKHLFDQRDDELVSGIAGPGPASWTPKTSMIKLRGVHNEPLAVTTLTWSGKP